MQRTARFAVASHDTASAVVAVPAEARTSPTSPAAPGRSWAGDRRSRGNAKKRWSQLHQRGRIRGQDAPLKNVMGLWLLQECRQAMGQGGPRVLLRRTDPPRGGGAAPGPAGRPRPSRVPRPGDMPSRIRSFCEETGQRRARRARGGGAVRLESLALKYRYAIEQAEELAGRTSGVVNVVGGGVPNELSASSPPTRPGAGRAGPVEATALGNLMVQAYARGHLASLEEIREAVRSLGGGARLRAAGRGDRWQEAFEKLRSVIWTERAAAGSGREKVLERDRRRPVAGRAADARRPPSSGSRRYQAVRGRGRGRGCRPSSCVRVRCTPWSGRTAPARARS